jgi:chromosome segregation ATPase
MNNIHSNYEKQLQSIQNNEKSYHSHLEEMSRKYLSEVDTLKAELDEWQILNAMDAAEADPKMQSFKLELATTQQEQGKLQENDARIVALMKEMKNLKEAHMVIIDDSHKMEKEIDMLTQKVTNRDSQLSTLQNRVDILKQENEDLMAKLNGVSSKEETDTLLNERDARIAQLEKKNNDIQELLSKHVDQVDALTSMIKTYNEHQGST